MQRNAKMFRSLSDGLPERHAIVMDVSIRKRGGILTTYPQILWKRLWKGGARGPASGAFSGLPEKRAGEAKHRWL